MSSLYPVKRKAPESYITEFDILKSAHRFLREDGSESVKTWEAKLAKKYEDSLFKEFAVCDLKHYKNGNIALRWRTEDEVISGAGESSCGNTRCTYHDPLEEGEHSRNPKDAPPKPKLTTVELPFSYVEQGETTPREVLVKVVLCSRCLKKLTWKRDKEKKEKMAVAGESSRSRETGTSTEGNLQDSSSSKHNRGERRDRERGERHRSLSRSRSPRRRR